MKDQITDSINHFWDRLKSPFGGAFIITWTIVHWRSVYYFFFVNSAESMTKRLLFLKMSFDYGGFCIDIWMNFGLPAALALLALLFFYGFSLIAGTITGLYKRHIEPKVGKWLGTADVTLTSIKDEVQFAYDEVTKERDKLVQTSISHVKAIKEKENEIFALNEKISTLIGQHKTDIERLNKTIF